MRAPLLLGLCAFALSSAAPTRALADGSEVVVGVAPETPAPTVTETAPRGSPPASPPPSTTMEVGPRVAALVLGGVAVASAGVGIGFGVVALNEKSKFDSHPNFPAANLANEYAVVSDVCLGGAVVAAVTSIVLLVRSYESPPAAPPKESHALTFLVSPMITLHGGGAGAALRF